jgi:hypothetical protein
VEEAGGVYGAPCPLLLFMKRIINKPLALVVAVVLCASMFTISAPAANTGKTITIRHNIDVSGFLQTSDVNVGGYITGIGSFYIDDAQSSAYAIKNYWTNYANNGRILKAIRVESNNTAVTQDIPLVVPTLQNLGYVPLISEENGLGFGGDKVDIIWGPGTIGVAIRFENAIVSDDVTVTYVWATDESPKYTLDVTSDAHGSGLSQFEKNDGTAAVHHLAAEPDVNYMLDYWECVSGSGTYGGGAEFNATEKNIIDIPDDYRYYDSLTVTLTENSSFKAHFKPAKIILLEGASIFPYASEGVWLRSVEISSSVGINAPVRIGSRAELNFQFKTPGQLSDTIQLVNVGVELYKGDSTESGDWFFSGSNANTSLTAPGGMYFGVRIPSIQQMDGFTAVVTLNGGKAVSRYYPLESGLILDDALENDRALALVGLDAVLAYSKESANYTTFKRQIGIVYDAAVEAVKTAETAEGITAAANTAIDLMSALISENEHSGVITVTVSVDKLTVSGEYIVEPTLMRIPAGTNAMHTLLALLEAFYPEVEEPYRLKGGYLEGIWDPKYTNESGRYKYPGYLSEFDAGAGWMYSVNNVFPNVGAGAYTLKDGDVMRWQYAGGHNSNGIGLQQTANKDALTRKIAEINNAGVKSSYGEKYTTAMAALTKHTASQSEVNAAFIALHSNDTGECAVYSGYGGVVVPSDARGNFSVIATEQGYVINGIWIDGVKLEDTYGKTFYTTKTAPARSIIASFIYNEDA